MSAPDHDPLTEAVAIFLTQVRIEKGQSELTARTYQRHLDHFRAFARKVGRASWDEVTTEDVHSANEALYAVRNATFLLICHDDVVPGESTVRVLVEEAYRSNAGIVGPCVPPALV